MSDKNTLEWTKVLPKVVNAIKYVFFLYLDELDFIIFSQSICRLTGMRPVDVNAKNANKLWEKLYGNYVRYSKQASKLKKGDKVRVALEKPIFSKGFHPNFSDHIFTVDEVSRAKPNFYIVRDSKNQLVEGKFYKEQLQKITQNENTSYRIEKILEQRKSGRNKQYLVKFIGYIEPEWIYARDIID